MVIVEFHRETGSKLNKSRFCIIQNFPTIDILDFEQGRAHALSH